ncbi:MAG: hypothetical protein PF689_03980, partial [Deltaproteobacteria bacterium]|nr:hypothetical protein [Deltaproteobacteria bacterium]
MFKFFSFFFSLLTLFMLPSSAFSLNIKKFNHPALTNKFEARNFLYKNKASFGWQNLEFQPKQTLKLK